MKQICKYSFYHSVLVAAYILLVALFMHNANRLFGSTDTIITGMAAMLLFTLSALVVGGLIIGKPIFLYIDGKKKDAISMLVAEGGWLLLFFIIALINLAVTK